MNHNWKKWIAAVSAAAVLSGGITLPNFMKPALSVNAASESIADQTEVGTLAIGGGGFVSGIVTGKHAMYARTDVGGAYRYDYEKEEWIQLMDFVNEEDRGFLSIDAICIDPNDDNTIYLLAGCAYFSAERTAIFKSTDGGETFTEHDVTNLIKVHGNGYGRQFGEAIAVDPDNSNIIYCGGDTNGLIVSTDAGETWSNVDSFNDLGLFTNEVNWPAWTDNIEKTTVGEDYTKVNGIGNVMITGGKVYVGVSDNTIGANIYVADVGGDNWEPLSEELPQNLYPSRINLDADGNLLISYVKGIAFDGSDGAAYRYDVTNHTVTDISPRPKGQSAGIGAVVSDPNDASKLIATSCGLWWSQLYGEVENWNDVPNGDLIFRSDDGGETWYTMQHGCSGEGEWGTKSADYLDANGYSWIEGFAVHWSGAIAADPEDSSRVLVTSGNGVFVCDDIWAELPQFHFEPKGIEEIVALDMISAEGSNPYSAIGDYDGFEHVSKEEGLQHRPVMGSTKAIAYCPSNPLVMVRASENDATCYYTLDGGKNWIELKGGNYSGGKAAITELEDGSYRIFRTTSGKASYTDDFGATWKECTGTTGTRELALTVDLQNPQYVYAYTAQYNEYYHYSKPAPDFEDAHYVFMVSDDYGATFTSQDVCMYDQCDVANRIGYLGEGEVVLGAGWYGAYHVTDYGKNIEKLDSVFYCKSIGYGAPEKEGGLNTLYIYGKPMEDDVEGVYRSTDAGKTWVLINSDHLYGGTGNGNFLVGDMNTFGTVYMSTVGCGIVYMESNAGADPKPGTTTTTTTTTMTTTTITNVTGVVEGLPGDVNLDGKVDLTDVIVLNKYLAGMMDLSEEAVKNANCDHRGSSTTPDDSDASTLMQYVILVVKKLPVTE